MLEPAPTLEAPTKAGLSALKGLRIALVVPSASAKGGSERQLQLLVPALQETGATVCVYSASPAEGALPFPVEVRPAGLGDSLNPVSRVRARSAVADLCAEISASCDVVDFQRVAPFALCARLSQIMPTLHSVFTSEQTCPSRGRYLRRSSNVCPHAPGLGCLAVDRKEHCLAFQNGAPFGWRDRVNSLLQIRRNAQLAQLVSAMTFNSRATADLFARHVHRPAVSRVLHPPLVAAHANPARRDFARLAFVGRVEDFKGVFDLLRVLELLRGCTLDVLGDGSALPALRKQVASRGLGQRVRFHGWVGTEETAACLASASCLLVPSRLFEAWGMVGPEAIAQGCPVVAYDSGGIGEWCAPPYGTLVPVGDVAGMERAAGEWLARMAEGLDTSRWRDVAGRRWGLARYLHEYGEALGAAVNSFRAAR